MITSGLEYPEQRGIVALFLVLGGHALAVLELGAWVKVLVFHEHVFHLWTTAILFPICVAFVVFGRGGYGYYSSKNSSGRRVGFLNIAAQVVFVNVLIVGLIYGVDFAVHSLKSIILTVFHQPSEINWKTLCVAAVCFAAERIFRQTPFGGIPIWTQKRK